MFVAHDPWSSGPEVFRRIAHNEKYPNFTSFPSVEILWKGTVSAKFWAIRTKPCRNCAFQQNLHTRKLDEITVFFAVAGLRKYKSQRQKFLPHF